MVKAERQDMGETEENMQKNFKSALPCAPVTGSPRAYALQPDRDHLAVVRASPVARPERGIVSPSEGGRTAWRLAAYGQHTETRQREVTNWRHIDRE